MANSSTSYNYTVGQYGREIASSFLNYFFEELEAQGGLEFDNDTESTKRQLLKKTAARFIQVPSSFVASQATGLLKSDEPAV